MAILDPGTLDQHSGNDQRRPPEGPLPHAAKATAALKLQDEGWPLHLWENCNLGDPQLVTASRREKIY